MDKFSSESAVVLDKFRKLSVGRELKMIELKKKIDELEGGTSSKKK